MNKYKYQKFSYLTCIRCVSLNCQDGTTKKPLLSGSGLYAF
jgi:hypothetical protein